MSSKKYSGLAGIYAQTGAAVDKDRLAKKASNDVKNDVNNDVKNDVVKTERKQAEKGKSMNLSGVLNDVTGSNNAPKKVKLTTYVEPNVYSALEKFAAKKGRGAKSDLVNKLLEDAFKLK